MDVYSHGMKRRQSACGALFKIDSRSILARCSGRALALARAGRFAQSSPPARRRPGAMPLGAEPCAQIIHLKGKFYSSNSSRSQSDQSKIHFSESSVHGEVDLTISVGSKALVDGIVESMTLYSPLQYSGDSM